jgi:hypothetical protein
MVRKNLNFNMISKNLKLPDLQVHLKKLFKTFNENKRYLLCYIKDLT